MIPKTYNWRRAPWIGKDGLIIFDDTGYGEIQEELRKDGYIVFGGSKLGDKMEMDRSYGQKIFKNMDLKLFL